jgi:hypothetical protein
MRRCATRPVLASRQYLISQDWLTPGLGSEQFTVSRAAVHTQQRAETLRDLHETCPFLLPNFMDIGSAVLNHFCSHIFLSLRSHHVSETPLLPPLLYPPPPRAVCLCNATAALRLPTHTPAIIHWNVTSSGIRIAQLTAKVTAIRQYKLQSG